MKIDLLNEHIIEMMGQDARVSSEVIAKKLKVAPATIRRRVNELINNKVMRIVAAVDPNKVGLPLAAIVAYDAESNKLDSAVNALARMPEVKWISTTTGRFDIISLVQIGSTDELYGFINKVMSQVDGLKNSETFVCMRVEKGRFSLMHAEKNES